MVFKRAFWACTVIFLCFIYNIDLILAAVWTHHNGIIDLLTDIIYTHAGRFFMCYIDQIRVVS